MLLITTQTCQVTYAPWDQITHNQVTHRHQVRNMYQRHAYQVSHTSSHTDTLSYTSLSDTKCSTTIMRTAASSRSAGLNFLLYFCLIPRSMDIAEETNKLCTCNTWTKNTTVNKHWKTFQKLNSLYAPTYPSIPVSPLSVKHFPIWRLNKTCTVWGSNSPEYFRLGYLFW